MSIVCICYICIDTHTSLTYSMIHKACVAVFYTYMYVYMYIIWMWNECIMYVYTCMHVLYILYIIYYIYYIKCNIYIAYLLQ